MLAISPAPAAADPVASHDLVYASTDEPGIARRRVGRGFSYHRAGGGRIDDPDELRRIRALAIPPAWRDVWICPRADGHIQATGYDSLGRKQYRYHDRFRAYREQVKFAHLLTFAAALPALRARVAEDMRAHRLGRRKVLATMVHLLETTMIRVGNPAYARQNNSFGLTTLRGRHVQDEGAGLRLRFKGKSGRVWSLGVHDRRVTRVIRACQELPGQHLFQYLDDDGQAQAVTSTDINAYLREATGRDITAKDFRTWSGTVLAAEALAERGAAETAVKAKRELAEVARQVAARLGNTPTICRNCYIHPEVQRAYLAGELVLNLADGAQAKDERLPPLEAAVVEFIAARGPGTSATPAIDP